VRFSYKEFLLGLPRLAVVGFDSPDRFLKNYVGNFEAPSPIFMPITLKSLSIDIDLAFLFLITMNSSFSESLLSLFSLFFSSNSSLIL
jgi:hypothetical protein